MERWVMNVLRLLMAISLAPSICAVLYVIIVTVFPATWAIDGAVATVNGQQYATLQEAFDAAQSDDTVTLCSDGNTSAALPSGKKLTLHLKSHTITGTLTNSGTLVIRSSKGGGIQGNTCAVVNEPTGKLSVINGQFEGERYGIVNLGSMTLENGVITGNRCGMKIDGGTFSMADGIVTSETGTGIRIEHGGQCTVTGGLISTNAPASTSNEVDTTMDAAVTVTDTSTLQVQGTAHIKGGYSIISRESIVRVSHWDQIEGIYTVLTPEYWQGTAGGASPSTGMMYLDISTSEWYGDAVMEAAVNGWMQGDASGFFHPFSHVNRAAMATILYRMNGSPQEGANVSFADIPHDAWYDDAIAWALVNGMVTGCDDGHYHPQQSMTREQAAVLLYRYAQWKGWDTQQRADLSHYEDASDIADYAKDAMSWAKAMNLMIGTSDTTLSPKDPFTRIQAAVIAQRLEEYDAQFHHRTA